LFARGGGAGRLGRGEQEIAPGIRAIPTPGHTPHHQGLLIESDGEKAFFIADLVPTVAHLPLPWIMGYDVERCDARVQTTILKGAVEEDWLIVFEHDPLVAWGKLENDAKATGSCAIGVRAALIPIAPRSETRGGSGSQWR